MTEKENSITKSGYWCNNPELNKDFGCNCDRCRRLRAYENSKEKQ